MDSNHRFRTTTSFVSCPRRTSPVALILCVGNVTRSEISADQGMAKLSLAPHMPNMMANATNASPIRKRSAQIHKSPRGDFLFGATRGWHPQPGD